MKRIFLLFALTLLANNAFSQNKDLEYFITGNGNLYIPINNSGKGMYPILGYDKEAVPKFLIGGFGAGLLITKQPKNNKLSVRGQINLSKHTYWDEAVQFKTVNNLPAGLILTGSSDYAIGTSAIVHYKFSDRSSIGTGLGTQILLISLSQMPAYYSSEEPTLYRNRHYKPIMPVLPVELSYKSEKKIFNIRYEQGLLNRFKGEVKKYRKDHFGLLTFEIGFKFRE